jgi:hypothetical protein
VNTHISARATLAALVLLVLGAPRPASPEVYRSVAPDGTITYSDRPQPQAEAPAPAPAPADRATTTPTGPGAASPAREPAAPREAAPVRDAASAKPVAVNADDVLELSGVKPQLVTIPAKLGPEFRPRRGALNAEDAAALEQIVGRNFAADRLYTQIRTEFRRRADARKLAAVADWLRSPVGRKITALEVAAGLEPEAGQKMLAFAPGGRSGPTPARVALVERIDWAAGVTDGALESVLAVARAMATAVNRALPPDERQTSAQIEREIQQLRGQTRARLAQATTMFMLYEYRSVDDDELQQYADFLASDSGHWYSATMSKAMIRTVALAAQKTATETTRAIPPQRWAGAATASPQH